MFVKYPKTKRIPVPEYAPKIKGKSNLSKKEVQQLLNGKVTITEKMDGANTAIIRTKDGYKLQKRGSLVGASEHEQFNFFKAWAAKNYDKIMKIPKDTIVYGELMYCTHSIYYDQLPDYWLAFAMYRKKQKYFMSFGALRSFCNNTGFYHVPFIAEPTSISKDSIVPNYMPDKSFYGTNPAEGVVIFNQKKQMRGKVVKPEFIKRMEEDGHWTKQALKTNRLASDAAEFSDRIST